MRSFPVSAFDALCLMYASTGYRAKYLFGACTSECSGGFSSLLVFRVHELSDDWEPGTSVLLQTGIPGS